VAKKEQPADTGSAVEGAVAGVAEELGRLLGATQRKAEAWISERKDLVEQLKGLRDTANSLLAQLGHQAENVVERGRTAYTKAREGDPQTRERAVPAQKTARSTSKNARSK
jgi:hypothetical protein